MKKHKIGIVVFDLHFPKHQKKLWNNIMKLTQDIKPDYFIFGGDNMDMQELSHWIHSSGDQRTLEGKRIKEEYTQFQHTILNPLCAILKKSCEKHWLEGNHENWCKQAIDRNPQGEGYWEVENNLNLKDWKIYPLNDICTIGKMNFIHGVYTNDAHAKKHVTNFESNVFYGHVHDHQSYTKITPLRNEAHIGMSIPCACELNPDYMRNKPNKWVNGLLVFSVYPDGTFTAHPIISTKGKFEYNGKVYS